MHSSALKIPPFLSSSRCHRKEASGPCHTYILPSPTDWDFFWLRQSFSFAGCLAFLASLIITSDNLQELREKNIHSPTRVWAGMKLKRYQGLKLKEMFFCEAHPVLVYPWEQSFLRFCAMCFSCFTSAQDWPTISQILHALRPKSAFKVCLMVSNFFFKANRHFCGSPSRGFSMMTKTSGHDTQQNSLLSKDGVMTLPEEGWSPDRSLSQKTHLPLLKNTQIFVAESSHTEDTWAPW